MTMLVRVAACATVRVEALLLLLPNVNVSATRSLSGSGGRVATMTIAGIMSVASSSKQHWQRRLPSVGLRGARGAKGATRSTLAPTSGVSSGCLCSLSHCAKGTSSVVRIARPRKGAVARSMAPLAIVG